MPRTAGLPATASSPRPRVLRPEIPRSSELEDGQPRRGRAPPLPLTLYADGLDLAGAYTQKPGRFSGRTVHQRLEAQAAAARKRQDAMAPPDAAAHSQV